ncbi:BrnT family toxin [Methylocaldum sp.]|uniref:BrnT family toxin n=1 Tax=Methylocaldum sp. TaxID=1969727 RepID=UPI003220127A
MKITFDPAKNARNIAERGLSFECVRNLDWVHAVVLEDTRRDYGERRFRVFR